MKATFRNYAVMRRLGLCFALLTLLFVVSCSSESTIATYTVSFNMNGGEPAVKDNTVEVGKTLEKPTPDPTKTGYTFAGWYKDEEFTQAFNFTADKITSNITLYAKWVVVYTVTFNTNGGSTVAPIEIETGKKIIKPEAPVKNGYLFGGWYTDNGTFVKVFDFDTAIDKDITLYANWLRAFSVSFNSNGGSAVETQQLASNQKVTKPDKPTKTDAYFLGWYTDNTLNTLFDFDTVITADITLYAKYRAIEHPANKQALVTLIEQEMANGNNAPDLNYIDTSNITEMKGLFSNVDYGYVQLSPSLGIVFNGDISQWDTSNVTDMSYMFRQAYVFNQPLNDWDVSKVTNMEGMFFSATVFNQPLDNWDVSKVTNMSSMFISTEAFNQPLNKWDVSNVTTMSSMFYSAEAFNQPLNSWDVSKVTNMGNMFAAAYVFNQPLNDWDVSKVTNMGGMFSNTKVFNQPLNSWDVSKVTTIASMFLSAEAFNQPLNKWDVSSVTDVSFMFYNAKAFNQDINAWEVSDTASKDSTFGGSGLQGKEPSWY